MSNSVWFEEVDKALVKLIRDTMQDPKIQIFFTMDRDLLPKDFKVLYPYARVHHLQPVFDSIRYDRAQQVVGRDEDKGTVMVEDSALPYILNYQLELISNTNTLNNQVTLKWFSKVKNFFTLKVTDNGGVKRNCFVSSIAPITLEERTQDDKVIFRCIVKLKVRVELDENTPEVFKMPTKGVDLNI